MYFSTLIRRNLRHYAATNAAVVVGVATALSVLSGALIVGESVRGSLKDLFLARLGRTDYTIGGGGFFRAALADDLKAQPSFSARFADAIPIIAADGLVSHEPGGARRSRVQVYGVDDRFWTFHGAGNPPPSLQGRECFLSPALARALGTGQNDTLLLRVEQPSVIPPGWLHGERDDVGRTIRLMVKGTLPDGLPEFSLRPSQSDVEAIVVPLDRLQRDLDRGKQANTILVSVRNGDAASRDAAAETAGLQQLVDRAFKLEDLGLHVRERPLAEIGSGRTRAATVSLESDALLLGDRVAAIAADAAGSLELRTQPVFTYLATTIRSGDRSIPYTLITALDLAVLPGAGEAIERQASDPPPIVVNDWAAHELGVRPGDPISIDFHVWDEAGQLATRDATFRFAKSIPIEGLAADRGLAPDYPGITDSPSFADWDPPFPVDLQRVRPQDEAYWTRFRTTPKAFVPLEAGQRLWGTRYGRLTAVRFTGREGQDAGGLSGEVSRALVARLRPAEFGHRVVAIRAEGLTASRGATDFGEYFAYFSFFLVVSALLLAMLFFKLGVEQRLREVGVLRALGFPPQGVWKIFFAEGVLLSSAGALVGASGGVLYGWLVMLGLKTWWRDAVGTTLLELHVAPSNVLLGAAGGLLAALAAIGWALWRLARASPRALLAGSPDAVSDWSPAGGPRAGAGGLLVISCATLAATGLLAVALAWLGWLGETAGFFAGGTALLLAVLCAFAIGLRGPSRRLLAGSGWYVISRLGFRNAAVRPGRSALCMTLVAAATFIVVAVDAFRLEDPARLFDHHSGAGGFSLIVETLLPVHHDPSTPAGREALNLSGAAGLAAVDRWSRFRLRPGDDASCLNLYRPREPRILAPSNEFVDAGRFSFTTSLAATPEERKNPWLLLRRDFGDGSVPVIADANSLQYVLHRAIGDEIVFDGGAGRVRLKVVAALERSVFQSELLMSEANFVRLFPSIAGYRYFLIETDPARTSAAAQALTDRLRDFSAEVASTADRLAEFRRVENTYLTTFQMLGGLGLILGSVGLATVLVRNVLERRRELALLRAVGYKQSHLALMVISENALLLVGGLAAGTVCALVAIAPAAAARGGSGGGLELLIPAVLATGLTASLAATLLVLRSPLLPALKAE